MTEDVIEIRTQDGSLLWLIFFIDDIVAFFAAEIQVGDTVGGQSDSKLVLRMMLRCYVDRLRTGIGL